MADIKQDHKSEDVDSYGMGNSADPKNMQELTQYVRARIQFVVLLIDATRRKRASPIPQDAAIIRLFSVFFSGTNATAKHAGQISNDVRSDYREKYPFHSRIT